MASKQKRPAPRRGFTLTEILVVVAIIAVLMSLTAVAVFRTIGTQQLGNTKSELSRVEAALKKAWRSSADQFSKEPIPPTDTALSNNHSVYTNTVLPIAGNDRLRAKVIWTKLRLKQAFPNNFNEALNPAPLKPLPYYVNALGALGFTAANTSAANPQNFESSACLLLALQRGEDGPGLRKEDIGNGPFFHDFPTGLNNGLTVTALIDGWQKPNAGPNADSKVNPLVFVRWPVMLNGAPTYPLLTGAPLPKFNDPDDPTGELASSTWQNTPGCMAWFTNNCHPLALHPAGQEPTTYRIFPIIASGGPNCQLGFNPITIQNTAGSVDSDDLLATVTPATP